MKLVLVGDSWVGKTSLLISYTTNRFPSGSFIPSVFDDYTLNLVVEDRPVNLELCDMNTSEGFEEIRALSYPDADVFMLCYSVDSSYSLSNILTKWIPEVRDISSKPLFTINRFILPFFGTSSSKFVLQVTSLLINNNQL